MAGPPLRFVVLFHQDGGGRAQQGGHGVDDGGGLFPQIQGEAQAHVERRGGDHAHRPDAAHLALAGGHLLLREAVFGVLDARPGEGGGGDGDAQQEQPAAHGVPLVLGEPGGGVHVHGDHGGEAQQDKGHGDGDEGGEAALEAVHLLLVVAGADAGVLAQEDVVVHAGDDENGDGGGEEQEKDHPGCHHPAEECAQEHEKGDAQQHQPHPARDGGGKAVHVPVPEGGVLAEAAGHVPPEQGVHIAAEQIAQAQDGLRLGVRGIGLPLAHRLAGHLHLLRQVLLGHVGAFAQELQVFSKCHWDDLLSRCPHFRAGHPVQATNLVLRFS